MEIEKSVEGEFGFPLRILDSRNLKFQFSIFHFALAPLRIPLGPFADQLTRFPRNSMSTACSIDPAAVISPEFTKNISSALAIVFRRWAMITLVVDFGSLSRIS